MRLPPVEAIHDTNAATVADHFRLSLLRFLERRAQLGYIERSENAFLYGNLAQLLIVIQVAAQVDDARTSIQNVVDFNSPLGVRQQLACDVCCAVATLLNDAAELLRGLRVGHSRGCQRCVHTRQRRKVVGNDAQRRSNRWTESDFHRQLIEVVVGVHEEVALLQNEDTAHHRNLHESVVHLERRSQVALTRTFVVCPLHQTASQGIAETLTRRSRDEEVRVEHRVFEELSVHPIGARDIFNRGQEAGVNAHSHRPIFVRLDGLRIDVHPVVRPDLADTRSGTVGPDENCGTSHRALVGVSAKGAVTPLTLRSLENLIQEVRDSFFGSLRCVLVDRSTLSGCPRLPANDTHVIEECLKRLDADRTQRIFLSRTDHCRGVVLEHLHAVGLRGPEQLADRVYHGGVSAGSLGTLSDGRAATKRDRDCIRGACIERTRPCLVCETLEKGDLSRGKYILHVSLDFVAQVAELVCATGQSRSTPSTEGCKASRQVARELLETLLLLLRVLRSHILCRESNRVSNSLLNAAHTAKHLVPHNR